MMWGNIALGGSNVCVLSTETGEVCEDKLEYDTRCGLHGNRFPDWTMKFFFFDLFFFMYFGLVFAIYNACAYARASDKT